MTKSLIDIAKEIFGTVECNGNDYFDLDEAGLKDLVNAVNAQNGEDIGYGVIDRDTIIQAECSEEACVKYVQFLRSSKAFNLDEIFIAKLYLAPQTMPPEWAEYVGRLELALENYSEKAVSIKRYLESKPTQEKGIFAVVTELSLDGGSKAQQALATNPKG